MKGSGCCVARRLILCALLLTEATPLRAESPTAASLLERLAWAKRARMEGDHARALGIASAALADAELAHAVPETRIALDLEAVRALTSLARPAQARKALDRALGLSSQLLARPLGTQHRLRVELASLAAGEKLFEEAARQLCTAIEIDQVLLDGALGPSRGEALLQLGADMMRLGNAVASRYSFQEACRVWSVAIGLCEKLPGATARYLLARGLHGCAALRYRLGENDRALSLVDRALDAYTGTKDTAQPAFARVLRVRILVALDEQAKAAQELARARALAAESKDRNAIEAAVLAGAQALLAQQKPENALGALRKGHQAGGTGQEPILDSTYVLIKARALRLTAKPGDAARLVRDHLQAVPWKNPALDHVKAGLLEELSHNLGRLGRWEEAKGRAEEARRLLIGKVGIGHPRSAVIRKWLIECLGHLEGSASEVRALRLEAYLSSLDGGKMPPAWRAAATAVWSDTSGRTVSRIEKLLLKAPNYARGQLLYALALTQSGDAARALRPAERAYLLDPDSVSRLGIISSSAQAAGKLEKCAAYATRAIIEGADPLGRLYAIRGLLRLRSGAYELASRELTDAIRLHAEGSGDLRQMRALANAHLGRWDAVEQDLDAAESAGGLSATVLATRAYLSRAEGHLEAALHACKRAQAAAKEQKDLLLLEGVMECDLRKWSQAAKSLREGLSAGVGPRRGEALLYLWLAEHAGGPPKIRDGDLRAGLNELVENGEDTAEGVVAAVLLGRFSWQKAASWAETARALERPREATQCDFFLGAFLVLSGRREEGAQLLQRARKVELPLLNAYYSARAFRAPDPPITPR